MLAKICCPVRKTFRGELTKPAGIELPYPDTSLIREDAFLSQSVFVDRDHRAHVLRNRAAHQPRCSFRNATLCESATVLVPCVSFIGTAPSSIVSTRLRDGDSRRCHGIDSVHPPVLVLASPDRVDQQHGFSPGGPLCRRVSRGGLSLRRHHANGAHERHTAEAKGLLPAIDCHPDARVRYLGVGPACPSPSSIEEDRPRTRYVNGYTRKDGTTVDGYLRAAPLP